MIKSAFQIELANATTVHRTKMGVIVRIGTCLYEAKCHQYSHMFVYIICLYCMGIYSTKNDWSFYWYGVAIPHFGLVWHY